MAGERDIQGWFLALRGISKQIVATDLPAAEREKAQLLAEVGLMIVESIVLDLNRTANALEYFAAQGVKVDNG